MRIERFERFLGDPAEVAELIGDRSAPSYLAAMHLAAAIYRLWGEDGLGRVALVLHSTCETLDRPDIEADIRELIQHSGIETARPPSKGSIIPRVNNGLRVAFFVIANTGDLFERMGDGRP